MSEVIITNLSTTGNRRIELIKTASSEYEIPADTVGAITDTPTSIGICFSAANEQPTGPEVM